MLNSLYKLGQIWIESEDLDKIGILLDAQKLKNTKTVLVIEFDKKGNKLSYLKVSQEDYDSDNINRYLYRKGSSRGTNITPSSLITETEKTFNLKFLKWFENNKDKDELIENIYEIITNSKDIILNDINYLFDGLNKDFANNVLLTIAIVEDNKYKYIGDYPLFKDILITQSSEKYFKSGKNQIKGEGTCFLCDSHKEVFGLVSNSIGFAFSTPDKVGNVPEVNIKNQWKQLPICGDCALFLEAGKKFVEKYLSFSEFGLSYYVIPQFIFDSGENFEKLFKIIKRNENDKAYSDNLVLNEDILVAIGENINDIIEFKFLYFQKSNNAFDIVSSVESILPSWLKQIYENQQNLKHSYLFSEDLLKIIIGEKTEGNLIEKINSNEKYYKINQNNWYLGFLRDFFSRYSKKYFIDIVSAIMSQKQLDYNFLIGIFMKKIRENFKNNQYTSLNLSVLKSVNLLVLLSKLNLIKGDNFMRLNIIDEKYGIEEYENIDFGEILDSPDKKSCFLLGILTKRLMYIQYKELGSSPFVNKLWGLSLDQKKIKKLYPMVLNKLNEYKASNYFINLNEKISLNLLESENNWKLSRDETSYYFVLGYTLSYTFNFKKNEKNGEKNE